MLAVVYGDYLRSGLTRARAGACRLRSWRRSAALTCLVTLAVLLTGASILAYQAAEQRQIAEQSQLRTHEILTASATIKVAMLNSVRGERGYVITNNPDFLTPYARSRPIIRQYVDKLVELTADHPGDAVRAGRIRQRLADLLVWQSQVVELQHSGQHWAAHAMIADGDGRRAVEFILVDLDQIEERANAALVSSTASAARLARNNELYQYGITAFGFLLLLVSMVATRALRRSADAEALARAELHRRAITDELTGLANRRELLASLDRAIADAQRNRRPLALAIIDIDHFKRINDNHGHPAGDAVIRRIALLAVEVMRGQDTVGRLGGEEFAVVLPDCETNQALIACERLSEAVRLTDLEMETGANVYLTLSTGIAVFERNDTADSMIARADAALYAAKHGGRNQVKLAA